MHSLTELMQLRLEKLEIAGSLTLSFNFNEHSYSPP